MKIPLSFTREHLAALELLSTPEGRDALSEQACLETILEPGQNPHLPRQLIAQTETELVANLKEDGIGEKIGGLLSVYLKDRPVKNAGLMDFYHSYVLIIRAFRDKELELEQAQDALTYLADKYVGSQLAKASEFAYHLYPNDKFQLEAEAVPINLSGQTFVHFKDFKLETCCGEQIAIPEKYKGLCESLMLHFGQEYLLPPLEPADTRSKIDIIIDELAEKAEQQYGS